MKQVKAAVEDKLSQPLIKDERWSPCNCLRKNERVVVRNRFGLEDQLTEFEKPTAVRRESVGGVSRASAQREEIDANYCQANNGDTACLAHLAVCFVRIHQL
jgi:hypothetical protein